MTAASGAVGTASPSPCAPHTHADHARHLAAEARALAGYTDDNPIVASGLDDIADQATELARQLDDSAVAQTSPVASSAPAKRPVTAGEVCGASEVHASSADAAPSTHARLTAHPEALSP